MPEDKIDIHFLYLFRRYKAKTLESRYKKKSRYKKHFAADRQISYIEIRLYNS